MLRWFVCLAVMIGPSLASAEVLYPAGTRVGLDPPKEMTLSTRFSGFENAEKMSSITVMELPGAAYSQAVSDLSTEELRRQGIRETMRQSFKINGRDALLIGGDQTEGKQKFRKWIVVFGDDITTGFVIAQAPPDEGGYTNSQMVTALKSVTLRPPLSLENQAEALPFTIGDTAGFRIVRVIGGNSIVLTDGPKDANVDGEQPVAVIGLSVGGPTDEKDYASFSRQILAASQNLKNITPERSEGFHIKGDDWYEIVARAVDTVSARPVVVMQTIRFRGNGYIRMLAMVKQDNRTGTLSRFLRIINSVEFKES